MKEILYFAPLHGVTNFIFRNVYFKYFKGYDYAMAPFVMAVTSLNVRKKHVKDLLPVHNPNINIIPQILSNNPDDFIALSQNLVELGYTEINWNLGCPYRMVANKFRGSGLLPFPDRIDKFLDTVIPKLKSEISLKIRIGRNDKDEIFKLIPIFNKYPLKKIFIHPRTGIQMYKGNVDLETFSEVSKLLNHKIIYNGDIKDLKTWKMLKKRFSSIDSWMIGRWAISNPFLALEIKNEFINTQEKIGIIKAFHDELFSEYKTVLHGPGHLLDKMKEIWTYLHISFDNPSALYKKISYCKNIEEYLKQIDKTFDSHKWLF